jgi:glutaminase
MLQDILGDRPQLQQWFDQALLGAQQGHIPQYVPGLAIAQPDWFAVEIRSNTGQIEQISNLPSYAEQFVLMSVVKPFLLLYVLEQVGRARVFEQVGQQPSAYPFHSLQQLSLDQGFPRNPMINSGAIALTDLLPGDGVEVAEAFRQWLNRLSGSNYQFDRAMVESIRGLPNQANIAIANYLHQAQRLQDPKRAITIYNHICCLTGSIHDLSQLGLLLNSPQKVPQSLPQTNICLDHQTQTRNIMFTCGLYEASADYGERISWPTKSGVSGALLSILPNQGSIALYSPPLDSAGNSVAGMGFLEAIASHLR